MGNDLLKIFQDYLDNSGIGDFIPPGKAKIKSLTPVKQQGARKGVYLVILNVDGMEEEPLILRLCRSGKNCQKEFKILQYLRKVNVPVPKVYVFEDMSEKLGVSFVITEYIKETPDKNKIHRIKATARSLVKLHAVPTSDIANILGIPKISMEKEFSDIKFLLLASALSFRSPLRTLRYLAIIRKLEKYPVKPRLCLIHCDLSPDNVIFSQNTAYLVDWERAALGDPTLDIAFTYNFFVWEDSQNAQDSTMADSFLQAYIANSGILQDFAFYRMIAAIKVMLVLDTVASPGLYVWRYMNGIPQPTKKEIRNHNKFCAILWNYITGNLDELSNIKKKQ